MTIKLLEASIRNSCKCIQGIGLASLLLFSTVVVAAVQELRPSGCSGPQTECGASVAIDNNILVIGATGAGPGGQKHRTPVGMAFIFERLGGAWTETAALTEPDAAFRKGGEDFGWSVAVSGNLVAVGAPNDTSGGGPFWAGEGGAVYIFRKDDDANVWRLDQRLTAPRPGAMVFSHGPSEFGYSLAIDGDQLIVGDPSYKIGGALPGFAGAVFIYRRNETEWVQEAEFFAPDKNNCRGPDCGSFFGISVGIDSQYAVVGDPESRPWDGDANKAGSGGNAPGNGLLHVYKKTSGAWQADAVLKPDADGGGIGFAVAIDNGKIVASKSPFYPPTVTDSATSAPTSVSASDSAAAVGDTVEDESEEYYKAAYLFSAPQWAKKDITIKKKYADSPNYTLEWTFVYDQDIDISGGKVVLPGTPSRTHISEDTIVPGTIAYVFDGTSLTRPLALENVPVSDYEHLFSLGVATDNGCVLVGHVRPYGVSYISCGHVSSATQVCSPDIEPEYYIAPDPEVLSGIAGEALSATSVLPDVLVSRDRENIRLKISNNALPGGTETECHSSSVRVDIEVGEIYHQFLSGLTDQSFILKPGESKSLTLKLRDLTTTLYDYIQELGIYVRSLEHDILFGTKAHVRFSTNVAQESGLIREEDVFLYRYLDVSDEERNDEILHMAPVLADSPGDGTKNIQRQRLFVTLMDTDAVPEFSFGGTDDSFSVELATPHPEWVLPAYAKTYALIHDPADPIINENIFSMNGPNHGQSQPAGTIDVIGRGMERTKVNLNASEMEELLEKLSKIHSGIYPETNMTVISDFPSPQSHPEDYYYSTASKLLITAGETEMFDTTAERIVVRDQIKAGVTDRYDPVKEGIIFLDSGASLPVECLNTGRPTIIEADVSPPTDPHPQCVKFHWRIMPAIVGLLGHAAYPYGPNKAPDNQSAVRTLVTESHKYTNAELYFRLNNAFNRDEIEHVTVFLNSFLQISDFGSYELGRTDPDLPSTTATQATGQRIFANNVIKTAAHELGHTLSLQHPVSNVKVGLDESQLVKIVSGNMGAPYVLIFDQKVSPIMHVGESVEDINRKVKKIRGLCDMPDWKKTPVYKSPLGTIQTFVPETQCNVNATKLVETEVAGMSGYWINFFVQLNGINVPLTQYKSMDPVNPVVLDISMTPVTGVATPRKLADDYPRDGQTTRSIDLASYVAVVPETEIVKDLMIGSGRNDNKGELRFKEKVSLEQLKLSLKLDWTVEDMRRVREFRFKKSILMKKVELSSDGYDDLSVELYPGAQLILARELMPVESFDFGTNSLNGEPIQIGIDMLNPGDETLIVRSIRFEGESALLGSDKGQDGFELAAGGSSQLMLTFKPQRVGEFIGLIILDTNAGERVIPWRGSVRDPQVGLEIIVSNNNAGGARLATEPLEIKTFGVLKNSGQTPITIFGLDVDPQKQFSISNSPIDSANPVLVALGPGETHEFGLTFSPQSPGLITGTITLISTGQNSMQIIPIIGTGLPEDAAVWGKDYVAVEYPLLEDSTQRRFVSDANGSFEIGEMPSNQNFHIVYFDKESGLVAHDYGTSPADGAPMGFVTPVFGASKQPDSDGDSLPDDVEFAIGTDPGKKDSDGDGLDDADFLRRLP